MLISEVSHVKNMFVELLAEFLTEQTETFTELVLEEGITIMIQISQKDEDQCYFQYTIKQHLDEMTFENFIIYLSNLKHKNTKNFEKFQNKFNELLDKLAKGSHNLELLETFWLNII